MKVALFCLSFFYILNAFETLKEVPNNYKFTTETSLHVKKKVIDIAYAKYKHGYFKTDDGYNIYYVEAIVENEKASIVISSGRTEAALKYKELIYDLNKNGYSVYISDHRGQGLSEREYKQDKQLGYISDFNHYVSDLKKFVDLHVKKNNPKKLFLLAHSMGGAIASLYIEAYPYDFDAVAMTSPMHMPNMLTHILNPLLCIILEHENTQSARYAFTQTSYDDINWVFEDNRLTHSLERYNIMLKTYEENPRIKLGGVSSQWAKESCIYSKKSVKQAYKIQRDVVLFSALEDEIVDSSSQEEFCVNASKHCKGYGVKGAYHELLIEKDSIRNSVLAKILDFFGKH